MSVRPIFKPEKQISSFLLAFTLLSFIGCTRTVGPEVSVFSSSADGDRLTKKESLHFSKSEGSSVSVIEVDEKTLFQKMDGFGATFNEAGMICLNSLTPESRDVLFRKLFDTISGAGYTLMKSPVAACDFASAGPWYTYDDYPGDTLMSHFTIERDLGPSGLITFIKKARSFGRFEIESPMDFAPDWMYNGMNTKQEKNIKPVYYNALAEYYLKYLKAYSASGVIINYLALFNESVCDTCPLHGYSSVTYSEMRDILQRHLLPRLNGSGLSTQIIAGETCFRYGGLRSFPALLDDQDTKKIISRLAVHGYDFGDYSSLTTLHQRYPAYPIWMTEICYVKLPVFEFSDGEYWGNMIMNDVNNWVSGWIYWNMILDTNGGPWLTSPQHGDPDNNHQHPVVIVDRKTGEVTYTGLYYYLAHFSRFVRPGAYRLNSTGGTSKLNFAGFLNTDGTIVLNVINKDEETRVNILWRGQNISQILKAHSITTFMWKN